MQHKSSDAIHRLAPALATCVAQFHQLSILVICVALFPQFSTLVIMLEPSIET